MYMNEKEEGVNVIASRFSIGLRKAEPSVVAEMKSKRQKLTHEVSSCTVVSSPIAIEEPRPLPPKKQILQRMQVSEVSSARIEKSILYEGTVVHVDKSSVNASSCSLTVDWDNGTTSCVEYPDEDIRIIGRLGTFLYDSCSSRHLSPFISSSCWLLSSSQMRLQTDLQLLVSVSSHPLFPLLHQSLLNQMTMVMIKKSKCMITLSVARRRKAIQLSNIIEPTISWR